LLQGGVELVVFLNSLEDIVYDDIISVENLLLAWEDFLCGKRKRKDVQKFQVNLMDNILKLHSDLKHKIYVHGAYEAFNISDPKPRNIHKASVRDRLLHHSIYRVLYPAFDSNFISHSYSCRKSKGTHKALDAFATFARKASRNHTVTVWVLKCDIKKFFASIDHEILMSIFTQKMLDRDTLWLLSRVIESFETASVKGLSLGNLTSQLFVNIYMNEFDQFMKHECGVKYYIRYADDFVILSLDKQYLENLLVQIQQFLEKKLLLQLHPHKVSISTFTSGVDFLGWVHFPHCRVLRIVTKRRMLKNIKGVAVDSPTVQSYLGMLQHGDTHKIIHNF